MHGERSPYVCIGAREAAQHWRADGLNRLIMGRPGSLDPTKRVTTAPEKLRTLQEGSPP